MLVVVNINGKDIVTQEVDAMNAINIAERLASMYHIDELNAAGVKSEAYVDQVPSKMNEESFLARPEAYDELYFQEQDI